MLVACATLTVLAAAGMPPARAATAFVHLFPNVGPPTILVGARGQGFGATETVVLMFDATPVGHATSTVAGVFALTFRPPASAIPGPHTVTATGQTSGTTATATFLIRTNWAHFHYDSANTGYNPYENVLSPSDVGTMVQRWAVPTGGGAAPDPIVAYGRVYVAPADGIVRALDPKTGALLWSYDTKGTMSGAAPTAANNLVYASTNGGLIVALSASTGALVWQRKFTSSLSGTLAVANGLLYASGNRDLALNAATGDSVWVNTQSQTGVSPAVVAGREYFMNTLTTDSLDATTGAQIWQHEHCNEDCSLSPVAVSDGIVFFDNFSTHAWNAIDGTQLWIAGFEPAPGGPAVGEGSVYWHDVLHNLYAVDEYDGTVEWVAPLPPATGDCMDPRLFIGCSAPALANGVVYVGSGASMLAIDAADGSTLWQSAPSSSAFAASPAVSDGQVFTSTTDGTLYAFGLP
jgi:outer membrane protein assembly factor BamB